MPVYVFRCHRCGRFDAEHPMASVPGSCPCLSCGDPARRIITAVALSQAGSPRRRAVEAAERSAEEPQVVAGPPPRPSTPPITRDPRHQKLPRP